MVNKLSTRAQLLMRLREKAGETLSGAVLADDAGVSRTAVWKGIKSLCDLGYPITALASGYSLDPQKACDFIFPWEFGEREAMFRYFEQTGSTMDRARELAARGAPAGTVVTAEKQSAGRGRNGNTWASRQGGLFCTVLLRPGVAIADYCVSAMQFQIAVCRALSSLCAKPAHLRWPNDVYIGKRKIAGLITELEAEGDMINWLAVGIGVNVNNTALSPRAASCAEIAGRAVPRHAVLLKILDEAQRLQKRMQSGTAYAQGNRLLAAEWNSLAGGIGAKAAVAGSLKEKAKGRVLARGTFTGIDPAGRCIIKTDKGSLYFNPGPVSIVF